MLVTSRNIYGGGDQWLTDASGVPVVVKLDAGSNQTASFTLPSLEYGYEVWVDSKEGVTPPKYQEPIALNTSTMVATVTFPTITSAQLLTEDSKVHVLLRVVK